jgi:hypothetical protein
MSNRTVRIYGSGYGSVPATVTATVDGSQVFSGTVPTQPGPVPSLPAPPGTELEVLFTFDLPIEFQGNVSLTTEVADSPVVFSRILANYGNVFNNKGQYISTGADVYITSQGMPTPDKPLEDLPQDPRSAVTINGVQQIIPDPKPPGKSGTWWIVVSAGSTMSSNVAVAAGRAEA